MEILGDLRKEYAETKVNSKDRVADFARKLFPVNTVVNGYYKKLILSELLGQQKILDGRPVVEIEKAVESETGQKGFIISETFEEKAIYKWKTGDFNKADHILSDIWRQNTTQEDLLKNLKESLKDIGGPECKSFIALKDVTLNQILDPERQEGFLAVILKNNNVDAISAVSVFGKWIQDGRPLIRDCFPYAFHCLLIDMLFTNGLVSGLITTRPTNRLDIEYLYYLPFCNVFTSNDNLHKNIAPLILRENQKFIVGEDLKKDLKNITTFIDKMNEVDRKIYANKPPVIEGSITFGLWKEYYDYPDNDRIQRDVSEKEKEYMKSKIQEFSRASDGKSITLGSEDGEFILRKSYLNKDDLCFCGSGMKVIDCCLPEKEFMCLTIEEMKRQIKPVIEDSYSKTDHVRFTTYSDQNLPAVLFVYSHENKDTKGHLGLVKHYRHEELMLTGKIEGSKIKLSFVEIETGKSVDLIPLPFSPKQVEMFVKGSHDQIALLWGLTNPKENYGVIIPTNDEGKVNHLLIKGFQLLP